MVYNNNLFYGTRILSFRCIIEVFTLFYYRLNFSISYYCYPENKTQHSIGLNTI